MKLQAPENDNYACVVTRLKSILPLENCDNVVATPLLGFQAILSKDHQVGDLGVVFPAECQLSEEFCRKNGMFRHSELNDDKEAKGYLEDSRRVKALKFRGHRSDCLFMPLESLAYTKAKISELKEGDVFDTINGHEICRKYVIKVKTPYNRVEKNKNKFVRVDTKLFPEHYDTDNFFRNRDQLPENAEVVVTAKLHGTSVRIANTLVKRKHTIIERLATKLPIKVQEWEYDNIYGSRKVVKDANNADSGFYEKDIWTHYGKQLDGILPQGFMAFAEIIGWVAEGSPIQKGYTYSIPDGQAELYIYRIAQVNPQGRITDLSWDQVREFCNDNGLKFVPELWRGKLSDFKVEDFLDKRFHDEGYSNALPLGKDKSLVDEGVCIRIDGLAPLILKAKSPVFLGYETKMLDQEAVDLEAVGSEAA